ncbi:hypothetical protein V9T40_011964 [Parthenolecanium corni]|uniref:Uncharacterized protein n=1 Tax=Parthenolecanium corni TaxID=536013 RepID=A0AAN9TAA1_9HEMI
MADKGNTLPRSKKPEKLTPTPSTRKSVKSMLPSLPHRHKKNNLSVANSKLTDSTGNTESLKDTSDAHSIASSGTATSIGSPSASPLVSKNERISIVPKSPKPTASKSKEIRKSIMKGGKMLIPKFKHKNESAPVMVETGLDLQRTNRTDDELLIQEQEVGTEADGSLKVIKDVEEVFPNDDWSVKGTCERVQTIYQQGTRESVYQQEQDEEASETVVDSPNETVVDSPNETVVTTSVEPDTLSVTSNSSTPSSPKTPSTEDGPPQFNKKSPNTLKKEIMNITNRQVSEGNQYIAAKLERKISLQVR